MIPTQHTIPTEYMVGPVHCYSLEQHDQLILLDTGPPTEAAKDFLRSHLDLSRLTHVLISHCHIDHYGLAAWLEAEYGATVYLPFRDHLKITHHAKRLDAMTDLLGQIGFSREFMTAFRADMDSDNVFPDFPQRYRIAEEELPAALGIQVLPCPGHSQSDLIYTGEDWAVTGDTLLREIFQSPLLDIDLLSGERFRNYDAYCATLLKLATLREKKILPGHRATIRGVDYNISFYVGKLFDRARRNLKYPDLSPAEVVDRLPGDLQGYSFFKYLKASEIVFIRDFLADPQRLKDALEQIGLFPQLAEAYRMAIGAD